MTSLDDVMGSVYDVAGIKEHSRSPGHVPFIDTPRDAGLKADLAGTAACQKRFGIMSAEQVRYRERRTAERANSALK